jgi:hypothetical protein
MEKVYIKMKEKFNDMSFKEKSAIMSAWVAFLLGWAITIAGFLVPPMGDVADSVLWILGQALIYAASVFGITTYFATSIRQNKNDMKAFMVDLVKEELRNKTIEENNEENK